MTDDIIRQYVTGIQVFIMQISVGCMRHLEEIRTTTIIPDLPFPPKTPYYLIFSKAKSDVVKDRQRMSVMRLMNIEKWRQLLIKSTIYWN